jgi:hypothetical protein
MLRVKNWAEFQHYKDRNPPWIKLHKSLLTNYKWHRLHNDSKVLAMCLWLLASEYEDPTAGLVTDDYEEIAFKSRMEPKRIVECIKELIQNDFIEHMKDDSDLLAPCYQSAVPETEAEAKTESETEKEAAPSEVQEAFDMYNATAERCALAKAQKLTKARVSKIRARLKDCGGLEGWATALEKINQSRFCLGDNDRGWKADLDFMLQESSFVKLMEGKYDNAKSRDSLEDESRQLLDKISSS